MKPLYPALLTAAVAACQPAGQDPEPYESPGQPGAEPAQSGLCHAQATPIAEIQGRGFSSPMAGQIVTVRGVVTMTEHGRGLFLQAPSPVSLERVSHGVFVASADLSEASKGRLLAVTGAVEELGKGEDTLTAITAVEVYEECGDGPELPLFDARLPLPAAQREAFESMRVLLEQPLTVTGIEDVRNGEITLSALGILRAPTEVALPGPEAIAQARKNRTWSLAVRNDALRDLDPYTKIHAGAVVNVLRGVLGHDGRQLMLIAEKDLDHVPQPVPAVPKAAEDAIRVASFNLHEYFNGDGRDGGFPGERGARTLREYQRQAARIAAAVAEIRPDVLAVMELENDGYGPRSAVQDLRRSVSGALGVEFQVAEPESSRTGSDVIAVGLLFRSDRLEALGPARLLQGGSFGPLNRVPVAQLLSERESGERFLVVVNHLKSKGNCPESGPDTAQGDGQACWNATRVEGALEMARWANGLAAEGGTENVLLVGDFNAYRREDPVRTLLDQGLSELVALYHPGMPHYSYIYRGTAGTLDYTFASEALAGLSTDAFIWHINAAYPWSARPSEPWLRCSDHDPVVADFSFSQAATSD